MADRKMTMEEIERKNVETMKRRTAYYKKHPMPKSNKPTVGKPTKWDDMWTGPSKTTKK